MTRAEHGLRVGFSEVDVTPAVGEPTLVGAAPSAGVHLPLHARIAMFDDGARRAAIAVLDHPALRAESIAGLRAAVADAGGVEPGDVLLSCTHTHNGGLIWRAEQAGPNLDLERFASPLREAAAAAAAALEPVELRYGAAATAGLTFGRPLYADGGAETHGPLWGDDFVGFEGPVDEELQLVVALRPDGSVAGGLVGFSCHPDVMAFEPVVSADFPGALTRALADRHDGTFLFVQGTAGNLSPSCWIDAARTPPDAGRRGLWDLGPGAGAPWDGAAEVDRLTEALFAASETALASARPVAGGAVRVASRTLDLDRRWPSPEQQQVAGWFLDQDPDAVDLDDVHRRLVGDTFPVRASNAQLETMYAEHMVQLWELGRQSAEGLREQVEIQALAIGDLAFVAYPGELFSEFGLRTKAASPFAATFACGLANGASGYVPPEAAFGRGGYETRLYLWSYLAPGAGEAMTAAAVDLLEQLRS